MPKMLSPFESVELAPVGVSLDLPPYAAPANVYTGADNMRVTGAGMARANGVQPILAPLKFPPKFVQPVYNANGAAWLYAGAAGVAVADGVQHVDVTPAGWSDFLAGRMTGVSFSGYGVFNDPVAPPWYWDGTFAAGAVKPLPGWLAGKSAKCISALGSFLFAGSVGTDDVLAWSDVAAPGNLPATWTPTAANFAGSLTLPIGIGPVQAMRAMGAELMVYRTGGTWAVYYAGRPFVHQARRVADTGAASTNCVADVMGRHAVLTTGDIVLTDGVSVRSIGDRRVKQTLFSRVSEGGLAVCHAFKLETRSEVWFCLALGQDQACNVAYVWDYSQDAWAVVDLPNTTHAASGYLPTDTAILTWDADEGTWDSDFETWDSTPQGGWQLRAVAAAPFAAAGAGSLFVLDFGDLAENGEPVDAFLERLSMPIGDPNYLKLVNRVFPRFNATPGTVITVQVGGQVDAADPVTWETPYAFTVGDDVAVDANVMGRFLSVRFAAQTANPWTVSGFGIEYQMKGRQ
jgi:hypothetical protein